nr:CCR4-NOT transcription complex subunit 9-like [Malus domestica]
MATLPESLLADQSSLPGNQAVQKGPVEQLILELNDDRTRENALQRLSKIREIREDLAPLLWHSFGTTFTLLKEIIAVYRLLSTPNLTQESSNRACNTLSLFQCIAAHPETREPFLRAIVPFYIYPFLNTTEKDKPHEYLRLSSLGVIGALVKACTYGIMDYI